MSRVAITALFGGSGLNTRGMLRHLRLESWAGFNLLDFEKAKEQIALIRTSEEMARIRIERERYHQASIELVHKYALEICKKYGVDGGNLRVAYVRPVRFVDAPVAAYHLWNCFGFDTHSDRDIVLPASNSLVGDSLKGQPKPMLFDLSLQEAQNIYRGGSAADRYPYRLLAADRKWVAIFPLKGAPAVGLDVVTVAVCVDSNVAFSGDKNKFLSDLDDMVQRRT